MSLVSEMLVYKYNGKYYENSINYGPFITSNRHVYIHKFNTILIGFESTQIFFATTGTFTSPGYPGNYLDNLDIYYQIKGTTGNNITVYYQDFALEDHRTCLFDFVSVC